MIIDCDANATYAPDQGVRQFISATLASLGNPSSLHRAGQRARALIEDSREALLRAVGAGRHDKVVFTSGATEANNMVINAAGQCSGGIVSTTIEHHCILQPLQRLAKMGLNVSLVSPDVTGQITSKSIDESMQPDNALVSVMSANNETGVINPITEIVEIVRKRSPKALIHTDAAQLLGKGGIEIAKLGVDLITVSAHKLGGLSGTGALIIRDGVEIEPLLLGGAQEGKLRGGTENVLGIAVFGAVLNSLEGDLKQRCDQMRLLRDSFESQLSAALPEILINGRDVERLPNTSSIFIPGVRAADLIVALDLHNILISSGAACSSGKPEPSHVLRAMGQSEERARSTIRVSFRGDLPPDSVEVVVAALAKSVARMRQSGSSTGIS